LPEKGGKRYIMKVKKLLRHANLLEGQKVQIYCNGNYMTTMSRMEALAKPETHFKIDSWGDFNVTTFRVTENTLIINIEDKATG
jgi:hypothetical protein